MDSRAEICQIGHETETGSKRGREEKECQGHRPTIAGRSPSEKTQVLFLEASGIRSHSEKRQERAMSYCLLEKMLLTLLVNVLLSLSQGVLAHNRNSLGEFVRHGPFFFVFFLLDGKSSAIGHYSQTLQKKQQTNSPVIPEG